MDRWPALHEYQQDLQQRDLFEEIKLNLGFFGSFAKKSLLFSGTWKGLHCLRKIHDFLIRM